MENNNLSLVLSIAALLFSVLSPFLSALINGIFRLKEKRIDLDTERAKEQQAFYDHHRAEVIERYISAAGAVIKNPCAETMSAYGAAKGEIYLYVDEYLWPEIDELESHVKYHQDIFEGMKVLSSICKQLSSEEVRPKRKPEEKRDNKRK